jgi:hypothetical protein
MPRDIARKCVLDSNPLHDGIGAEKLGRVPPKCESRYDDHLFRALKDDRPWTNRIFDRFKLKAPGQPVGSVFDFTFRDRKKKNLDGLQREEKRIGQKTFPNNGVAA